MPRVTSRAVSSNRPQTGFPFALWALWTYLLVAIGRLAELVPGFATVPLAKLAIGACLLGLIAGRQVWSPKRVLSHAIPRTALMLLILSGLSLLFSVWRSASLQYFLNTSLVVAIGFVLTFKICTDRRRLLATLYAMVLIGLVQACTALASGKGRISAGLSYDPNDLAYLLVTVLPLAFAFVSRSSGFRRGCNITLCALFIIAILLTQSRGGLLGLVAFVAYYYVFSLAPTRAGQKSGTGVGLFGRIALVAMAGGIVLIAVPDTARERLATVFNLGQDYNTDTTLVSGRVAIWERSVKATLTRPIGYGLAAFGVVDMQTGGLFKAPHNSIVEVLVELGFLGCFLFLRIYWLAWRNLGRPLPDDLEAAVFCRALKASLIANFVSGFFLSQAYSNLVWTLFAVITLATGTIAQLPVSSGAGAAKRPQLQGPQ